MTLDSAAKFTSRRTYVVRYDAKPGNPAGRIENFVTGEQIEFASADELIQSLAGDLPSGEERASDAERE